MKPSLNVRFWSSVLVIALIAIPGVISVANILSGPDESRDERIARTPDLPVDIESIKRFPGDFRFYIKERYGLKKIFVWLNSKFKASTFGVSPYPEVLIGEDGFLFLGGSEATDFHQNLHPFSGPQKKKWETYFVNIAKELEERKIRYSVLIAPNKHTIYPDKLPGWVNQKKIGPTMSDTLIDIAEKATGVRPVKIKNVLENARAADPSTLLYHRTDSHWNDYGAAIAINALLDHLDIGRQVLSKTVQIEHGRGGDLARMIGQAYDMPETANSVRVNAEVKCFSSSGKPYPRNQFDPLHSDRITCKNTHGIPGRVLVFIDSFGVSIIPSLSSVFTETVFAWQYQVDLSLIDELHPDLVIQQFVERKLSIIKPENLMTGPET